MTRPLIPKEFLETNLRKLFLDIETSGLNPPKAVPLSIAMVCETSPTTRRHFEVLIDPTDEQWENRNAKAMEVNGLTREVLKEEGVSLEQAKIEFLSFFLQCGITHNNTLLVGQNPSFDIKFLDFYFPTKFMGFPPQTLFDNIELFKITEQYDLKLKPYKNSRNTHNMSKALKVQEEDNIHTAMGGALAAIRNFNALRNRMQEALDRMIQAAEKGTSEGFDVPEVLLIDNPYKEDHGYIQHGDKEWIVHPKRSDVLIAT